MQRGAELGVGALAVTDHDAVSGLREAAAAALAHGLGFLNGVEITSALDRLEVHVVGLGIRPESAHLKHVLTTLAEGRSRRLDLTLEKLESLGLTIARDTILARTAGAVGRMHIAQELRDARHVRTVQEAFDRYIGRGKPAFVPSARVPVEEAVDAIHAAGGLAFVGHPGLGGVRRHLPHLLTLPFDGIEAYHPQHKAGRVDEFIQLAEANRLLVSGGSDCHGRAKGRRSLMGSVRVPMERYAKICAALGGHWAWLAESGDPGRPRGSSPT